MRRVSRDGGFQLPRARGYAAGSRHDKVIGFVTNSATRYPGGLQLVFPLWPTLCLVTPGCLAPVCVGDLVWQRLVA
jgi:hypothetical protein